MLRHQGGRTLVWAGSITQVAALLGAIAMFAVVNYTQLFVEFTLVSVPNNNGSS